MQFPIIATGDGDFNCFVQKNKKGFPNREALGEGRLCASAWKPRPFFAECST
jgi:hypothetical protein